MYRISMQIMQHQNPGSFLVIVQTVRLEKLVSEAPCFWNNTSINHTPPPNWPCQLSKRLPTPPRDLIGRTVDNCGQLYPLLSYSSGYFGLLGVQEACTPRVSLERMQESRFETELNGYLFDIVFHLYTCVLAMYIHTCMHACMHACIYAYIHIRYIWVPTKFGSKNM